MTLDERLRENLDAAARSVEPAAPKPIGEVRRSGRRKKIRRAGGLTTLAGSAIAVVVFVAITSPERAIPVGVSGDETVVSSEPLVVQAQPGPIHRFSTVDLGVRVDLAPLERWDAILAEARGRTDGELLKITLLGRDSAGMAAYTVHSRELRDGEELQTRCDWYGGGGTCGGSPTAELRDGELLPTVPGESPTITIGGGSVEVLWHAPLDASVVVFTVNEQRRWMRPVGGVAVFAADYVEGDRVFLTAFDVDGRFLQRRDVARDAEQVGGARDCPITFPTDPDFSPPDGYPQDARVGEGWFGSAGLWTTLPLDGAYGQRKSVWWSTSFPGGSVEEQPAISVTWNRLDIESAPLVADVGTNAFTAEDGDFMIAGIDPEGPGCWEVTATYKGATVRYVYESR